MAFSYESIVPWGRNFDEYCQMFDLSESDLAKRILGCGDGPASFNTVCNAKGGNVVSVDPIYEFSREQIAARIYETFETVTSQTRKNREKFRWDRITSVEELGKVRMAAMEEFLITYESGRERGHYVADAMPGLGFPDNSFDLSLSSHFLFLYSDNLDYQFHCESIREMLRVSFEVRIFPLLDVNGEKSKYLDKIYSIFDSFRIEVRQVDYEFQIGGNEMLVLSKKSD